MNSPRQVKLNDRLFCQIEIRDPLICELIDSRAFQRLKGVNQYGGVNFVYPDRYQVSRYEHSIGVWYVLRSLGVDLEVQVAGLLHDIGHTAFSHMVDQALESESEDFHEQHMHLIPGIEELNAFLAGEGIILRDLEDYSEIKTSLPAVGADRLDYAMRDGIAARNLETDLGLRVLDSIELYDGKIVFTELGAAEAFAAMGLQSMWDVIYAPEVAVVYQALIELLRTGLAEGWINHSDLYLEDAELFKILISKREQLPELHCRIFEERFKVVPADNIDTADFTHTKLKVRYFDPPVLIDGGLIPLSQLAPQFCDLLTEYRSKFSKRVHGESFNVVWLGSKSGKVARTK